MYLIGRTGLQLYEHLRVAATVFATFETDLNGIFKTRHQTARLQMFAQILTNAFYGPRRPRILLDRAPSFSGAQAKTVRTIEKFVSKRSI